MTDTNRNNRTRQVRSPTNLPDPIAHQAIQHVWISITAMMMALACFSLPTSARADTSWDGTWFTCEFAQRQRAPDDGCAMFDDEGFRFSDGRLTYVRITASDETACRGEKVGQCFQRDRPSISITTADRGKLDILEDRIHVRYLFCKQVFYFRDTPDYREIWPDDDRCIWASKRRFYIARYNGEITETAPAN
ncbi:MAG: hypothetical protein CNE92_00105 [SAR116 cluster bacterium MED-G05]|jgi:hypothetical protein|nr:hypothetical protein [Rhodospirillaceae bacterium]PDH65045.1 MAG: hypothetical protein CNE92_00105 [SAR116 cluster bacterium MED-G05]HAO57010.1 hypothetical protein [Alphaproteobacteria bacterium]HCA14312.1 hypothetical protein [Alphaproteobacteria bacterium]HCD78409.1 hypothetical protein [Alphaproteobacteria bacterium]